MSINVRSLPWLALGLLASAGLLLFPFGSLQGDMLYLLVSLVATVLAWRGTSAHEGRNGARRAIAVGLLLSLTGDLTTAATYFLSGTVPALSIADIAYIGSYAAIAVGLLRVLREQQPGPRADVDRLIDLAGLFVVALLLAWMFVIEPTIADPSLAVSVRIRESVYPVLDAALIALLVRIVVSGRQLGSMVMLVAAGVGAWLASDLASLAQAGADNVWLRLGWLLGAVLFTASVWQPAARPRSHIRSVRASNRLGSWRIAVALLAVTFPLLVEQAGHLRGHHTSPGAIFAATLILVALAIARAVRLSRDAIAAREEVASFARFNEVLAVNSADAVVVLDLQGTILRPAPQFAALMGAVGIPTLGRSILDFAIPADLAAAATLINRAAGAAGRVVGGELRFATDAGPDLWLGVRLRDLSEDPDVAGVVCNLHDITTRKQAEERLSHQALHDALTGLPNRVLFHDRLEHAMRRENRTGQTAAVVYLDLDGFKDVNDRFGHAAGDMLLQEVSRRLVASVRSADTVARLGGDEFAVLIEESVRPMEEAEVVSARILQALSTPIDVGERPLTVSASLGIAISDPLATATSLVRDADLAMYHAKQTGRARAVEFEPHMLTTTVARIEMESELGGALSAGQFHLVYQPVVTLAGEKVVGFEALLRWQHPTLGLIPPDVFIPMAERSELINAIGRWVLGEACATVAAWQRANPVPHPLSIAVNVSGRQLASAELVDHVAEVLAQTGLEPNSLILEMTETSLVGDPIGAAVILHALHELGVRLAIDDFGTGYSSLSYLRQFPVDILKIDRSFVQTIIDGDHVPPIVRGLLDLGRTLGLEIVAEGVERGVQRDRLRVEGCDLAQGYLFARPMSAASAEMLTHVIDVKTDAADAGRVPIPR